MADEDRSAEEGSPAPTTAARSNSEETAALNRRMSVVLTNNPKAEDTAGQFMRRTLLITVLNALAVTAYLLSFAGPGIGYGDRVFRALHRHFAVVRWLVGGAVAILVLLYLFDFSYWRGGWLHVRRAALAAVALMLAAGCVLAVREYPAVPIALFFLAYPASIFLLKRYVYGETNLSPFLSSVAVALAFNATATLSLWAWWVATKHYYNERTEADFARRMRCLDPDECLAGYILWVSPLVVAALSLVLGIACRLLSKTLASSRDRPVTIALRIFISTLVLGVIGVWVATSVAGAGRISSAINFFLAAGLVILMVVVVGTVGWRQLHAQLLQIPILRKVAAKMLSSWMKALFLMATLPGLPFYLLLSVLNQWLRRKLHFAKDIESPEEGRLLLTLRCHTQMQAMRQWRWTKILLAIQYLSLFYMILNVGIGKGVTLFLSYLNGALAGFSLGIVTAIFSAVGLIMFLLPPVPGVPVYLAAGVILVESGRSQLGFFGATAFAAGVSFLIKLTAVAMQQKLIGEMLGKSTKIRQMVGINSITIKAIEKILKRPGLALDKTAILCGGPDWPTSVLTGILHLPLGSMLLGTCPVFLLIMPTTAAGAFLLRADEGGPWTAIGNVALVLAGLTQFLSLVAAAYYIEQTAENHREELEELPKDQEVLQLEETKRERHLVYKHFTDWHGSSIPTWARAVLVFGAACSLMAVYINLLLSESTFRPFLVTDTIKEDLGGNALTVIVAPLGWVVIGLIAGSCLSVHVFGKWSAHAVKSAVILGFQPPTSPATARAAKASMASSVAKLGQLETEAGAAEGADAAAADKVVRTDSDVEYHLAGSNATPVQPDHIQPREP